MVIFNNIEFNKNIKIVLFNIKPIKVKYTYFFIYFNSKNNKYNSFTEYKE